MVYSSGQIFTCFWFLYNIDEATLRASSCVFIGGVIKTQCAPRPWQTTVAAPVMHHSEASQSQMQSAFFSSGDMENLVVNETRTEAGIASVHMLSNKTVTRIISVKTTKTI